MGFPTEFYRGDSFPINPKIAVIFARPFPYLP